jgi:hypothetical protein
MPGYIGEPLVSRENFLFRKFLFEERKILWGVYVDNFGVEAKGLLAKGRVVFARRDGEEGEFIAMPFNNLESLLSN